MKTVRMVFSKTGRARYISHLDLTRAMTRVMRRAGIPLWYTEGFNRHPYLTFAAPLSLGYEGIRETMDLRLEEEITEAEFLQRVNETMPEGLQALSLAEAVEKVNELAAARYRITTDCPAETVEKMLSRSSVPVERRTKKKEWKTVDIRPAITDPEVEEDGGNTVITVTLPCGSENNVNPGLLMTALSKESGREYHARILRLELLDKAGNPFR